METIRQTVTIPANRELLIRLPETAAAHDTAEIIILLKTSDIQSNKLTTMREAAADPLYLADLREINDDFCFADADGVNE